VSDFFFWGGGGTAGSVVVVSYFKDGILEFAVWLLLKMCVGMLVW
jgi:hypothetical protein